MVEKRVSVISLLLLSLVCLLLPADAEADSRASANRSDSSWQAQSSSQLQTLLKNNSLDLAELEQLPVTDFYRQQKYRLLWSDESGRLNRAYDLLQVLIDAGDEGLRPADYYLDDIKQLWSASDLQQSAGLDLLLSAALYRYSNHVFSGRFSAQQLDLDWHIRNTPLDISKLLVTVSGQQSIISLLEGLPPQHSGYQSLKKALRTYRDIKQQGGWPMLKTGPALKPGRQHQQVKQLRQRLQLSGDLAQTAASDIDIFDHELGEAVQRFQRRHGLVVDASVGPETRRALNISVSARIKQQLINMERWRWLPRQLGKRYLMVNMSGFELYIMENGSPVLTMPVIIGKAYRSTPSFSGLVTVMEYNPYWTIPARLVVEDILPHQLNDASFLQKKSIRIYSGWGESAREIDPQTVDWKQLDKNRFPYWLRQDPGPENALGQVKFLFSNPYAVYLHGTPDRHLFDRVVRTFSSGCIRVKDPVRLAAYMLNDGSQQMEEEVLSAIHLGSNQRLQLPVAMPIYLVYWTAWVDEEGNVNFRPDIYGRDVALNGSLDSDPASYGNNPSSH